MKTRLFPSLGLPGVPSDSRARFAQKFVVTARPPFALCLALSFSLGLLLAACGGGGGSPAGGSSSLPPVATTLAATDIGVDNAVLNGTVNPNGLATTAYFEWGTDPGLAGAATTAGQSIGSDNSNVAVNAVLTFLTDNTTYYYRVVGTSSAGTNKGDIGSFATLVPATQWEKTFGGPQYDVGNIVRQTSDSGFIVAGTTASYGAGDNDVYLIKTNASGDNTWTKTFGGVSAEHGYAVQQTADGGFIISGTTATFGAGSDDVYLIKTDASGDNTWSKTFGGVDSDRGHSVQQTSDGGYIIAGSTVSSGPGLCALYLIKTDASGNVVWDNALGEGTWQEGHSVQQTSDGGYVIAGFVYSSATSFDVYLVKTDASGNVAWTKRFGGAGDDYGYSVRQTADGGYVIAGSTTSFGAGSDDVLLIKTNASGDNTWTRTFGGTGSDAASSVQQSSDGGYVIAGTTTSFGAGSDDVYLIRTDASGSAVWTKTLGGTGSDRGRSVQQTADGGYVVTGSTEVAGSSDVYLIKLD